MDKHLTDIKLDKNAFFVVSLSDGLTDKSYWLSVGPIERLRHMETLRKINYGPRAAARLQRILEVIER